MKDRIKAELSVRGFYTLDLFRKIQPDCSFQAFQLILNDGFKNGDWVCSDGYWSLPKPMETVLDPLDIEVDYLLNTARCFTDPAEKNRPKLQAENYFSHANYEPKRAKLVEMFTDSLEGYQIVPGKFERKTIVEAGEEREVIKRKMCWQSQQVFMVEFDKDVKELSLEEVLENNPFLRENSVALVESIRSCYNDPADDTCNGDLRYRAFFVIPRVTTQLEGAEFIYEQLLNELPTADKSGSTVTNGAFGLLDANAHFLNNYIQPEYITDWTETWNNRESKKYRYTFSTAVNIKEIPDEYANRISELSYAGDGWSVQMLPCLFNQHTHDGWHSFRNAMGVFRHSDGLGYTFHCFKCNEKRSYRVKPRKSGKRRVKQLTDSEAVYQSLNEAEVDNQKFWDFIATPGVFGRGQRAILIQTDTGVGKDYAMLMEAKRNDVMSLNPHSRLSAQLHSRAEIQGLQSYYIKARHFGFDRIADLSLKERIKVFETDENVMCIHADRCQALLDRTGNCKDVLCNEEACEVYDFCKQNRYVSQIRKAAQCQIAHYSWVQLVTDPGSQGIVQQVLRERKRITQKELLWVVGEVDAQKLLNRHQVSVAEIQKGLATWGQEPAGELYRLLSQLCNQTLKAKERWDILVREFPKLDHSTAIRQLSRLGLKGYDKQQTLELTVSKALSEGFIKIESVSDIVIIPRVYPRHWTPIQQLDQFLTYSNNPVPPIHFNGLSLEFVTPPELHLECDTYVMQSATANPIQLKNLLTMMNPDIEFHTSTAERVEHHPDTKIFKVATGRYVRRSCFEHDSEWNIVALKDSIRPHLQCLLDILTHTTGHKFVNTYKAIYEGSELEDDPLIELLRACPGVTWSNWAAGFGLDLEPDTIMIEFGTNEPSETVLKQACSEVYLGDSEPLDFTYQNYHEHDGIRIEGIRTYTDRRVQAQYEQMVELSQYQMANRTRPVRNASLVLIYSSHPCKWLDGRVQWITPNMLTANLRELKVEADKKKSDFQIESAEKLSLAIELAKEGLNNKAIAAQLGYNSASSVTNLLGGLDL